MTLDCVDTRLRLARSFGEARFSLRNHGSDPTFAEIGTYDASGAPIARVALKVEELDRAIAALQEMRNVTLGHPKHEQGGTGSELKKAMGGRR